MGGLGSKGERQPGGGFYPGSEERYDLQTSLKFLSDVFDLLIESKEISFDAELELKIKERGIGTQRTLRYIFDKFKNNNDVLAYKEDIERVLEIRKAKDKSMYPAIAAMSLHNKHKWQSSQNVNLGGQKDNPIGFTMEIILSEEKKDDGEIDGQPNATSNDGV